MERFSKCIKQNLFKPFISRCALRRFLRYSPALKVRASVSVRVAVISGFLTIPCSGLPEAAAEVKR